VIRHRALEQNRFSNPSISMRAFSPTTRDVIAAGYPCF
jgi:hypothetical protein